MTGDRAAPRTRKLGRYELIRRLGRGGMGEVWLAKDPGGGALAIKRLLSDDSRGPGKLERVRRFEREAKAAMSIDHPGIAKVLGLGSHDGRPYIAMEYVEGESLHALCDGRALEPRRAAALALELAQAMAATHAAGVLHRDLKPANVLVDTSGRARIVDFGLARLADGSTLTAAGQVMGTPGYMSPEQVSGDPRRVGPAADVYGLGAILYHMLTGRPPFAGEGLVDVIFQVVSTAPVPPSQLAPSIEPALEAICMRCLEKSPRNRFANAAALEQVLARFVEGRPVEPAASAAPTQPTAPAAPPPRSDPYAKPWLQRLLDVVATAFGRQPVSAARELERATAAERAGDLTLARELLEEAIAIDPSRWEARARLAELHLRASRRSEAAFYFFQAFEAAGTADDQAMMAFRAADVLRELGRVEAARSILMRARERLAGSRYESYVSERLEQLDRTPRPT